MTNTTQVYWDIGGTPLQTYAWNVRSKGARLTTADPRGENRLVPGSVGRRYVTKFRDSRIVTLGMWVLGSNDDGTRPAEGAARKFDANWDALADLIDQDGQFDLTKRWWSGGAVVAATARAEYAGGWEAEMTGESRAEVSPDLLLADPWFYGADEVLSAAGAVTIKGDKPTEHVTVVLAAGQRLALADGRWIQNDGAGAMTIDCRERSATIGGAYANGQVSRNRTSADWMTLKPGAETITITGAGTWSLTYEPAYR